MEAHPIFDPAQPDVRVEFGMARAEVATSTVNRATAEVWAAIDDTLGEARDFPEIFVVSSSALTGRERVEFAERAAVADLAVRLSMSEVTVRSRASDARLLRTGLPQTWARFREGDIAVANARFAAELAGSLPNDGLGRFDDEIVEQAVRLSPAKFRARARVLRERIHSVALAERCKAAAETRGVWIENDVDGTAWLALKLTAATARQTYEDIDTTARRLARIDGEARTLAQLRADVAAGLLTGQGTGGGVQVSVAVTVPVMTLLGHSDEPGTLDGYGPIDADTARSLAAHAPSFTRLLTHPISGGLLDIDRNVYRPPADLTKWLKIVDVTCGFPGCNRSAKNSDIDHVTDHQYGGATRGDNLMHLCRHHHRLKHMTRWGSQLSSTVDPVDGVSRTATWTSPTGHTRTADPPPF